MARKTVRFTKSGIAKLPNDKPVVYRILTGAGNSNYVGTAQRGRARGRLLEHLDGNDRVPGEKVIVEQMKSIVEAREREAEMIAKEKPKYNEEGT